MVGRTSEVEKALYLRKYGVPFDGLTYVFGKNDMYWERIVLSLGRFNIAGTTIQYKCNLPDDLASDEKHTKQLGSRIYACLTSSRDCVLGASISQTADKKGLTEAYKEFKEDIQAIDKDYEPKTNNRDGWEAGLLAFQTLFSSTVLIQCFLHGWLKIQNRCRALKKEFKGEVRMMTLVGNMVWEIYEAENKEDFNKNVATLREWTKNNIETQYIKKELDRFCDKASTFAIAYDHPGCLRTSNSVDRPMKQLNKVLRNNLSRNLGMQYFHGHSHQANRFVRTWALIYNFAPYNKKTRRINQIISPAHKINQFYYHENWLQNLFVCGSLNGGNNRIRTIPQN